MAARYLALAKRENGQPLDPVARFHLGNGAEIHELHAHADMSDNGISQSCGAMVNYLYDLKQTERNHEDFALNGQVAVSRTVGSLTKAHFITRPKELTS